MGQRNVGLLLLLGAMLLHRFTLPGALPPVVEVPMTFPKTRVPLTVPNGVRYQVQISHERDARADVPIDWKNEAFLARPHGADPSFTCDFGEKEQESSLLPTDTPTRVLGVPASRRGDNKQQAVPSRHFTGTLQVSSWNGGPSPMTLWSKNGRNYYSLWYGVWQSGQTSVLTVRTLQGRSVLEGHDPRLRLTPYYSYQSWYTTARWLYAFTGCLGVLLVFRGGAPFALRGVRRRRLGK